MLPAAAARHAHLRQVSVIGTDAPSRSYGRSTGRADRGAVDTIGRNGAIPCG
ncbi:MAG: hypothetical protein AVDCRST_MAG66-2485 [uncultured Pseudonocardia sp.]|uniref:Uncharacterized protein n=1 Tax=uncultured Pseudonocardia sp. TaxID=211455 RepID=A0A6J4PJT5_9PSEU|nr:MAG: hypothetical protein AVDCRST_MAG66-2485 [uncultured Pseudonocardia sp.]